MMVEVNLTEEQRKIYNVAAHVWCVFVCFCVFSSVCVIELLSSVEGSGQFWAGTVGQSCHGVM